MGLASLFATAISGLELTARASPGLQIIRNPAGSGLGFLSSAHFCQQLAGFTAAFLLLVAAYPLALIASFQGLTSSFALLALIPFARAFEHLDYFRMQRDLRFVPAATYELAPQIGVTALTYPILLVFHDYRAVLVLMLLRTFIALGLTHAFATTPYRISTDQSAAREIFIFGWPLFLGSYVLFLSTSIDQPIISAFLGVDELARYSLAMSIISAPWFVCGQVGSGILLPTFSKAADLHSIRKLHSTAVGSLTVLGTLVLSPLLLVGAEVISFVFGGRYVLDPFAISLLSAAMAIKFFRFASGILLVAKGDSKSDLFSNLLRGLAIPGILVSLQSGSGILSVCFWVLASEIFAAVFSLFRLQRRILVPIRDSLPAGICLVVWSLLGLSLCTSLTRNGIVSSFAATIGIALIPPCILRLTSARIFQHLYRPGGSR
ncbi:MAG: oligosaccharide flippase family protein [Verrucomicrobia bacterium]|nr:oligosaccharide flippase family protein [Verrucomicrobiota bacterium]